MAPAGPARPAASPVPPRFTAAAQALAWLDDHIDFESTAPTRRSLPTLDRMVELAALLGDPQVGLPAIHITGTNGKGSTAAMVTALLMARGLSVGTYTSPNLSKVNERICVDTEPIDDDALCDVLWALAALEPLCRERPTRFELLTAAALRYFADEAVDVAVVEVGLGGTWDCTNVVDGDVAVITNISYDHTEVLGPTLEGIATDKAGIIKPGAIAVVGETDPALAALIAETAISAGALEVWLGGRDFDCVANRLAVGGRLVDLRTPGAAYPDVLVGLNGAHQGANAACAVAAIEAFFGAPSDEAVVAAGLGAARIGGRLEVLGHQPLVLVDGAHNVAGMRALAAALAEGFSVAGPTVAIVGMLGGRDPSAMVEPLAALGVDHLVACAPDSPRALAADVVAEAARAAGLNVTVAASTTDALERARTLVTDDGLLVACGSLYVVADIAARWRGEPLPGHGASPAPADDAP